MPNGKFPQQIAKKIGFTDTQLETGFIVPTIGNTYSACSLLGLASVLQLAKKDQRVLVVSYGSGAGSDAFVLTMLQDGKPLKTNQTQRQKHISYAEYARQTKAFA